MGFRVLHTNMHRGGWGGQPNRILIVSKKLKEMGHEVVIAVPKGATLAERAKEAGIKVYDDFRFPKKFNPLVFLSEVLKLARLIKREKIDVVHTHGSQDSWAASIAAKLVFPPRPVVRTRHNTFFVKNHFANRFLYRVLTDSVIVVSEAVTDVYKRSGVLGSKIETVRAVYSVVEPERFNQGFNVDRLRSEFSIDEKSFVFVKIARLAKEKGHEFFLKVALWFLRSVSPKAVFFALGEGPRKKELMELSERLGVSSNVFFTGLRNDVPAFLRICDVFLFTPTSGESLGTSALEALYMKVPVISFWVGGIDASAEPGKAGFLVRPGDVSAFFSKMRLLFENRKLAKKMGVTGRRIVEKKFLPQVLAEGNLWVYKTLLASRSA